MDHFDREDRNASIFRRHIGRALLNRAKDPYLDIWSLDTSRQPDRDREDARTAARVERDVSAYMRVNLSFSVIPVASVDSRLRLGEAIVATLHQAKNFAPSDSWLGHYSPDSQIRASGLWQKRALDADPLTADESLQLARIIVPGIPDKKLVWETTKSYYPVLLENGVKIYEYTPGFIHAKTFLCDDEYATVGSINLDYRSLYLHFECGTWMYKTPCISDIKGDFEETFGQCREITLENCRVSFFRSLFRAVLDLLSPLM
jgi:phosphatidylserine/phosphatidylglycerophosphate/cardiolipin synthase-like enzyme